jgi:hypothetical protein
VTDDLLSELGKQLTASEPAQGLRPLATFLSTLLVTPFFIGIALAIHDHAIKTVTGAVLTTTGALALLALPAHFAFGYRAKWLLKVLIAAFLIVSGIAISTTLSR